MANRLKSLLNRVNGVGAGGRNPRQVPLEYYKPTGRAWRSPFPTASDDLQAAYKALPYNQYVKDFISDGGDAAGNRYSDYQREGAYRSSVYLFACLRRGANLISELKIVGEGRRGGKWERLPETHDLNRIFADAGAKFLFQCYVFFAIYGRTLVYKNKTRRAVYALHRGQLLSKYTDGAIAGVHVIPNAYWTPEVDAYGVQTIGFNFNVPDEYIGSERRFIKREEVVYLQDFDPRLSASNYTSMVDLAINNAVTNAAIARWAANYFMSGALPLLLLSLDGTDPSAMTQSDAERYKNFIERAWQGVFGRFSMRAVFTERKLNVQQAGIEADKVQAPELDRAALNAIASVFQIAPDLIVPPEGGSDNARHKFLVMQAYNDGVIPLAKQWLAQFNDDFGLDGTPYRLVLDESSIRALEADRAEMAQTEINVFNAGAQRFGEFQNRLRVQPIPELENFINVNGRFQSIERVLRDDKLPAADILQYLHPAWVDGVITRNQYLSVLGFPPAAQDGYKYEIVPEPGALSAPKPPTSPDAPDTLDASDVLDVPDTPDTPDTPDASDVPDVPDVSDVSDAADGDKAAEIRQSDEFDDAALPKVERIDTGVVVDIPETARELEFPAIGDMPDACVLLMCADDPLLYTVRNTVMLALGERAEQVNWHAPGTWHCTLVYAPSASADALTRARLFMPSHVPAFNLTLNGVITFETPGGTCIALRIDRSDPLINLQAGIVTALTAQGVDLSPHSAPADYQPHITLGYAPPELHIPDIACHGVVEPTHIDIAHGSGVLMRIPSIRTLWTAEEGDVADGSEYDMRGQGYIEDRLLETYRRRAVLQAMFNRWREAGERPVAFPDAIAGWIDEALKKANAKEVINAGLMALASGLLDEESENTDNPIMHYVKTGRAAQMTPEDEIRAWERSALRNRTKAVERFEALALPPQIETFIRDGLRGATDKHSIKAVFAKAAEQLAALNEPPAQMDAEVFGEWAARMQENPILKDLVESVESVESTEKDENDENDGFDEGKERL